MKRIVLYATMAVIAGLFFANVYNSIVDVPNWQRDMPVSVQETRAYMATSNPGVFFRTFSPMAQILALAGLLLFWKRGNAFRYAWGACVLLSVLGDVFTFGYFYPRNDIIFINEMSGQTEAIRAAVNEWAAMNWFRSLLVLSAFVAGSIGLHRTYPAQAA